MQNNLEGIDFSDLSLTDMDDIVGGAKTSENIDENLLQTNQTQKCNCGLFTPRYNGVNLNICDNCEHSRAPFKNSFVTYCTKQKI